MLDWNGFKRNFCAEFLEAQVSTSCMLAALWGSETLTPQTLERQYQRETDVYSPYLIEDKTLQYAAIGAATISVFISKVFERESLQNILASSGASFGGALSSVYLLGSKVNKNQVPDDVNPLQDAFGGWGGIQIDQALEDHDEKLERHKSNIKNLIEKQGEIRTANLIEEGNQRGIRQQYREALSKYKNSRNEVDFRVIPNLPKKSKTQNAILTAERAFRLNVAHDVLWPVVLTGLALIIARGAVEGLSE